MSLAETSSERSTKPPVPFENSSGWSATASSGTVTAVPAERSARRAASRPTASACSTTCATPPSPTIPPAASTFSGMRAGSGRNRAVRGS